MDGTVDVGDLEQQLLFYKALSDDEETYRRIGGYMQILSSAESGEKLQDPVDESIRSVFSLVLENGIDPWEVDLSEFVKMYEKKVSENRFDMIVAGKLVHMAWKILRLQSESTRIRSEPPPEYDFEEGDDDFFYEGEPLTVPDVAFREAFQRMPSRPVTMFELIDAFEDARRDMEVQRERERVRAELKAKEPRKFDNKAHDEDDEKVVETVWKRILALGAGPILISDLFKADLSENLSLIVALLHLVRDGLLDIWQESYPRGDVYVQVCPVPGAGSIDERIPEVVMG